MRDEKTVIEQVTTCLIMNDPTGTLAKFAENGLLSIDVERAQICLQLPFYAPNWLTTLEQVSAEQLTDIFGEPVSWQVSNQVMALQSDSSKTSLARIKNIIVVASGKGGVGKSTVSVNLALALSKNGAKVGVLDADIYGPSIPTMLGVKNAQPSSADGKLMQVITGCGIACNSIGFLVKEEDAIIWRGPMASKALTQVLTETDWPELDYLVVDMPPGTGDIQLTMSQSVPLTGAVIVTTPQDVALIDAQKGVAMFNKVSVNIAGIIENMSYYRCGACGHQEAIFGTGGGEKLATKFALPFLGALPLHICYREDTDQGKPTVIKGEKPELIAPYLHLAETLVMNLYRELEPAREQIKIKEVK